MLRQIIYEQPIYPKNRYLKRDPRKHAEYRKQAIKRPIQRLHSYRIWMKPER